jgi:hypothetical protein
MPPHPSAEDLGRVNGGARWRLLAGLVRVVSRPGPRRMRRVSRRRRLPGWPRPFGRLTPATNRARPSDTSSMAMRRMVAASLMAGLGVRFASGFGSCRHCRPWPGVQWLANRGAGKFTFRRVADFPGCYSPVAVDLDGDGVERLQQLGGAPGGGPDVL